MREVQKLLFDMEDPGQGLRAGRSGTFVDNMRLSLHRWFRYSAGFSAEWVGQLLRESASGRPIRVLDPFAGSGTAVLEAESAGIEGVGIEAHPFVTRVARAKLGWRADVNAVRRLGVEISRLAENEGGTAAGYARLVTKCYPPNVLAKLDALKTAWQKVNDNSSVSELCWLALVSILRATSPVGTAQWQYILPNKSKSKAVEPFEAFEQRVGLLVADMRARQAVAAGPPGQMLGEDARDCAGLGDGWADLIVTSPPYANNYDYADATRLEMTFLGEINGWGDLQSAVRDRLVRSCTQHITSYADKTHEVLGTAELVPVAKELTTVCDRLEKERDNHGGKKPYHAMIAHYFFDLALVWRALRRVMKPGGRACFVIGDSAPYGIHVPVERWLGELALAAGFTSYRFEKVRDRNTKWKNRKHRVLLHEGRLWVEG